MAYSGKIQKVSKNKPMKFVNIKTGEKFDLSRAPTPYTPPGASGYKVAKASGKKIARANGKKRA